MSLFLKANRGNSALLIIVLKSHFRTALDLKGHIGPNKPLIEGLVPNPGPTAWQCITCLYLYI